MTLKTLFSTKPGIHCCCNLILNMMKQNIVYFTLRSGSLFLCQEEMKQ